MYVCICQNSCGSVCVCMYDCVFKFVCFFLYNLATILHHLFVCGRNFVVKFFLFVISTLMDYSHYFQTSCFNLVI